MSELHPWIMASIGGAMIGLAASLLLLFNGRVLGVSGIVNGLISSFWSDPASGRESQTIWRGHFIAGLLAGGMALRIFLGEAFGSQSGETPWLKLAVAGFMVGFGTVLGGGCTSGHGICGVSRFSPRSIVATLTFMIFGMLSTALARKMGWL